MTTKDFSVCCLFVCFFPVEGVECISTKLILKIIHRLFIAQDKEIYTISESFSLI